MVTTKPRRGRPPKVKEVVETKKKIGRPEKPLNMDQVFYWMDLQATAEEIAGSFNISADTLDRRLHREYNAGFAELRKQCTGSAKLSLRRYQFRLAEKNAAMAIWLGKQWLGQTDDKLLVPVENWQGFMDKTKNPLNNRNDKLRNDRMPEQQVLENESSLLHQKQERAKDII